jgi:hypothetical protein
MVDLTGIGSVADLVKDVADKIWPDPAARAQAELQIAQLDNQLLQGQMAINQVEAANSSLFVSGWRPFVGWVCAVALLYHYILQPLTVFVLAATGYQMQVPAFDLSQLITILGGLLGLGMLRTTEKMGDKGHLPWQK